MYSNILLWFWTWTKATDLFSSVHLLWCEVMFQEFLLPFLGLMHHQTTRFFFSLYLQYVYVSPGNAFWSNILVLFVVNWTPFGLSLVYNLLHTVNLHVFCICSWHSVCSFQHWIERSLSAVLCASAVKVPVCAAIPCSENFHWKSSMYSAWLVICRCFLYVSLSDEFEKSMIVPDKERERVTKTTITKEGRNKENRRESSSSHGRRIIPVSECPVNLPHCSPWLGSLTVNLCIPCQWPKVACHSNALFKSLKAWLRLSGA